MPDNPPVKKGRRAKTAPPTKKQKAFAWLQVARSLFLLRVRRFTLWGRSLVRRYRFFSRAVGSAILVAPPYLVGQYYQVSSFADEIKKGLPFLGQLLDQHAFLGVVAAGVWTFVMLGLYRLIVEMGQEQPSGWAQAPMILLRSIDNIVGTKEQRFSKYLTKLDAGNGNAPVAGDVFNGITKPGEQLNEIILGLYAAIDSLLKAQGTERYILKVNLAIVGQDGDIKAIHFHCPSNHPVRSQVNDLNRPTSAIKTAIRLKKPVVLESIRVESAKVRPNFVVTDPTRADEDGSLICYPVIYEPMGGAVIFVISIHVDQPGTFKPKFVGSYSELLKPFSLRIKLEYALLALKELTVNE